MSVRTGRVDQLCALCAERPSSRKGEHVLPTWLLGARFPASGRPYRSGPYDPALLASAQARTYDHFPRVMLPCCIECNSALEHRFETPARDGVLRLLDGAEVPEGTSADQVRAWLLKTWLLLAHPLAEYKDAVMAEAVRRWRADPGLFDWTVRGMAPPADLSAWMFRYLTPYDESRRGDVVDLRVKPARGAGFDGPPQVFELALQALNIAVVHHPSHLPEVAAAGRGEVVQLWPAPAGTPIPASPAHHHRPIIWRL